MPYADKHIPSAKIREMLDSYLQNERHPGAPDFNVSDLMPVNRALLESQGRAGVYAIYRADKTLIYIGMSLTSVARRLAMHFSERVQASPFWQLHSADLVQTILVARGWEAPSLEEFLVQEALRC